MPNRKPVICSSCGETYIPERRPVAIRRNYCPKCREAGVPVADASRAYRVSKEMLPQHSQAVKRLIAAGVIPAECVSFELVLEVNHVARARCEYNVTNEQMNAIADALLNHPEEAAAIARIIVASLRDDDGHLVAQREVPLPNLAE